MMYCCLDSFIDHPYSRKLNGIEAHLNNMAIDFSKLKILIVEDNQDIQQIIHDIIKVLNFGDVGLAKNGEDAYRLFKAEKHDIIITDWEMEPMNGLELIKTIRTDPESPNRFVPIIVVTGYAAPKRVMEARDAGMTEFVVKPFTAEHIIKRITHVINYPRDFVETKTYIGPNRRRHSDDDYFGPERRKR